MGQKVIAMPLCWGNEDDENACRKALVEACSTKSKSSTRRKVKKGTAKEKEGEAEKLVSDPSIILIGDVAYQHKPGAPSHFDILLSTLLKFATTRQTVVVFGTRMRMPASADLLQMFYDHFDEVIDPIEAQEINESFSNSSLGRSSLITIHVLKRKSQH